MGKTKTARQMERHLKGMGNHHRIAILLLLWGHDGITLEGIVKEIGANEKTIGAHVHRLHRAGLVDKDYRGKFAEHTLSPYGKVFARFLEAFRNA